jgi:hypothetical protein
VSFRDALRRQGGALAEAVSPDVDDADPGPGRLAASGPRCAGAREEYELLLEMIFEGWLLHYGEQRVVRTEDADLALLLGDQLYAIGLARVSALGNLDAVAELADLISLLAQAAADEDRELADAVWNAAAVAIGWGPSERHLTAKVVARAGGPGAAAALAEAADARGRRGS